MDGFEIAWEGTKQCCTKLLDLRVSTLDGLEARLSVPVEDTAAAALLGWPIAHAGLVLSH
jgi:hypothetical protein